MKHLLRPVAIALGVILLGGFGWIACRAKWRQMSLQQAIKQYHVAVDGFSRGDPEPAKRIFSHRDDVTLANPWGPAVRGWRQVSEALNFASSRFREGKVTSFEPVAWYEAPELATILELERWRAKVGGREDISFFDLRVTSTFRREDGTWKLVHRHADPITAPNPEGPLRRLGG